VQLWEFSRLPLGSFTVKAEILDDAAAYTRGCGRDRLHHLDQLQQRHGLNKCSPVNRSSRVVAAISSVTEIEDVCVGAGIAVVREQVDYNIILFAKLKMDRIPLSQRLRQGGGRCICTRYRSFCESSIQAYL